MKRIKKRKRVSKKPGMKTRWEICEGACPNGKKKPRVRMKEVFPLALPTKEWTNYNRPKTFLASFNPPRTSLRADGTTHRRKRTVPGGGKTISRSFSPFEMENG